ncbi:MAG: hypothetical protein HZA61_12195 [Candidatus Eisenbacteria bacterium]|uniref:AMP-activated protein kinase glycogen-binding domain-containing protein n=1 Tax=Eiseniibacteriota bacterium TaxID=2212470 RepID=A0A933SF77_UNCEI|nr:hypothetical protein [Candidatus Eisenbacteria bacterium]
MRRIPILLSLAALALLAVLSLGGCSTLTFVKRRLPPPTITADGVIFRFNAPSAKMVQLAGNWPENNWLAGQAQSGSFNVGLMKDEDGDGIWTRTEKLPPGRYQYKFVIDQTNWKEDPNNPNRTNDGYGGNNSVLDVR